MFDEDIVELLRNQTDQESEDYVVGIICKNGKIFELETKKVKGEMIWKLHGEVKHNIGAGIKKIVSDWRDISSHYIFLEQPNGKKLIGYQHSLIRDMSSDLVSISSEDYMVRYISNDP